MSEYLSVKNMEMMMWKPLQINKDFIKHTRMADKLVEIMEEMNAVDVRVLYATEDTLEAIVFVPL